MQKSRCTAANIGSIGKDGQQKLSRACIGVAGLGGVGGIAFELLVRAGIGKIKIADAGFFEESNANRQSLWSQETDGKEKAKVAQEFAKSVNSACKIEKYGEITGANSASFAKGCAAVIDATDRARSRIDVFSGCKKSGAHYIFSSALGAKGMLTVFNPKKHDFKKEFGMAGKEYKNFLSCDHSLGPVANAMGCLAAQQALNAILGEPMLLFPKILSFDAFSSEPASIHEF